MGRHSQAEPKRSSDDPYDRYRRVKYFGSLDGLRCLSIVGVIWCHTCGTSYCRILPGNLASFLGMGYMGVDLFFVISGFLITTLLLRERDDCGAISLPQPVQQRWDPDHREDFIRRNLFWP